MPDNGLNIRRLTLKRFRSVKAERLELTNPLFLVGENGSGKSNLLDAFAFVSECMRQPLVEAIGARGGLASVCFRFPPQPKVRGFGLHLDFELALPRSCSGSYGFEVAERGESGVEVVREQCWVGEGPNRQWFDRRGNQFTSSLAVAPAWDAQALVLPIVGGTQEFAPVLRGFSSLRIYRLQPEPMRVPQPRNGDSYLRPDGRNIAAVLQTMAREQPAQFSRLTEFLPHLVAATKAVSVESFGEKLWLQFRQKWSEDQAVRFDGTEMSDGMLRGLGILAAVMQRPLPGLVAIEEPELTIHPEAMGVVLDVLRIAAQHTQVVVSTHSPELIEAKWIQPEQIRVVTCVDGATRVSPLSAATTNSIRSHLMGAGEQFRSNALRAEESAGPDAEAAGLFAELPV